jgi:predicted XRE-type DNA-binding protein
MSVIDAGLRFSQRSAVITHDDIMAELLRQLEAKQVLAKDVAAHLGIARPRITEMVKGDRRIQQHEMAPLVGLLGMGEGSTQEESTARVVRLWDRIPLDRQEQVFTILETFTVAKQG